jgi:hypothetical protein
MSLAAVRLSDVASVVRSKNAGPYHVTFDIMFEDAEIFRHLLDTEQLTLERFAETYNVAPEAIEWSAYEQALGVKATFRRTVVSGDPGDGDVYGCQQHAPLLLWTVDLTGLPAASS